MAITVQKGVAVLAADSDTVTITSVDLARSFVLIDASTDSTTGSSGYQSWGVVGTLTDSTTLTLQRDGGVADAEVTWSVVTCDQGEFVVVARDSVIIASGDTTATDSVTECDLGRTMLIYGSRGNFAPTETRLGFATGKFNSSTQLEFQRGSTSTTRTISHYEAVEWSLQSGVRVTAGVADGSGLTGVTAQTSPHNATVTTSDTWLYAQARHESNGLEQCSVRVRFDTADILLKRYDTTSTAYNSHVAWQLVTFPADCCEQRTPVAASGDTTKDTTPTLVMDTASTIAWQTNNCNGTGTAFGRNAWNVQVLNSTTIRQKRSYSGQASESAISICDFSLLSNSYPALFGGHT